MLFPSIRLIFLGGGNFFERLCLNYVLIFWGMTTFTLRGYAASVKAAKPLTAALCEQKFSPPDPLLSKNFSPPANAVVKAYCKDVGDRK